METASTNFGMVRRHGKTLGPDRWWAGRAR